MNCIRYERKEGIGWVTLNRPEVLNAISSDMLRELHSCSEVISADDAVQAVVITGAGDRAFSAGADIAFLNRATPLEIRELARLAVTVNSRIETLGKIVVAAISGYALGGGLELAEACTFRIAAHHARFGHPEVRIGAVAGWGGTTRLPRLVGRGRATELLLTGDQIGAEEALAIGLVDRVVEKEVLLHEAENLARKILSNSSIAVRMTREAIQRGLDLSADGSAQLGADYFGLIASTEDFREGTGAFLEKRRPDFRGK